MPFPKMTRSVAVALAAAILSLPALAEEKKAAAPAKAADAKAPAMSPEEQKMMEEWAKYSTPGPHHAHLKAMEGTWKTHAKMQMDPTKPAEESTGTSVNKMILGGRFLHQEFKGTMMGSPFEGLGMTGYDIAKQKYVGSWMDTMGTMMMLSEGTCSTDGKTMTFHAEYDDPVMKVHKKMREVVKIEGPNKHTFEMWDKGPDGKDVKVLDITYTK